MILLSKIVFLGKLGWIEYAAAGLTSLEIGDNFVTKIQTDCAHFALSLRLLSGCCNIVDVPEHIFFAIV